jgi:hypothetical protein
MPKRNLDLPRSPAEMSTTFLPGALPGISHTSTMRLGLRRYATPQLLNLLVPCLIPVFLRASPEFESGTPPP